MSDKTILQHIAELVEEEHALRGDPARPDANAARLKHLAEQLDQCWDLLRQRRARREFGQDPDGAEVRSERTVEGYRGREGAASSLARTARPLARLPRRTLLRSGRPSRATRTAARRLRALTCRAESPALPSGTPTLSP